MKISVVIATCQRPLLLRRCLTALLMQDFEDYEIIVVSDGTDPASRAVVKGFSSPLLKYAALPAKKGPAAARNIGWRQAAGTLIAFTDDDTIPDTHWLSRLWQHYHGELEAAFTGRLLVPLHGLPTDYELNTAQLEKADFITANCACTKQALERVGGFDERFTTAWREDSDLEFKLLQAGIPIYTVKTAVVAHPVRKAPWGVSLQEQRKSMYNALLFKKFPRLYRQKIQARPAVHYYAIIGCCLLFLLSLPARVGWLTALSLAAWCWLTLSFTVRRLKNTRKTPSHILEMTVTSLLIPFLSVYWTLYGAGKYRVLFF
ncbi:MAG TPA: glycosyltransferase [Chitinophaga sp.]